MPLNLHSGAPTLLISAISVRDSGRFVLSEHGARNFCSQSVRPWSQTQAFEGRQKPPLRHQLDYTICWPVLRSVNCTAAPNANLQLQAADATAASLSDGEVSAVKQT
jgi:hypothetical protein